MRSSTATDTKKTVFIGIDNGPSGSIGIQIYNSKGMRQEVQFFETPTYMMQDYTKAKQRISQLDLLALRKQWKIFKEYNVYIAMERPLVNPGRFTATKVGLRVHQQFLDLCKILRFPEPVSLDSKQWQKKFLPKGTTGEELKKRSKEIGMKIWPMCADAMRKHKDADGMFISEWIRKEIMG